MKRIALLTLLYLFSLLGQSPLLAQLSMGGIPTLAPDRLRSSAGQIATVSLAPPSEETIASLIEAESEGFRTPYYIGVPQETAIRPSEQGSRSVGEEGNLVWQVVLESAGAKALQIYFSRFYLPEGSRLFLVSLNTGAVKGAFGAHNNNSGGVLAVAPLRGDRVLVRYEAPPYDMTLPDVEIGSISHCFRTMEEDPTNGSYQPGEPWFSGGYPCAPNVITRPEVEEISRSQVLMITRGRGVCSGALINNTAQDGTAYVLTAAHCMNASFRYPNDKAYRDETARQTIFFFNFRSPMGDRLVRGTEEQSLSGATIVAWDEERDLCLLRITGIQDTDGGKRCGIPASYRPYFSGWNVGAHQPPYVGLHHPAASVTRYNRSSGSVEIASFSAGSMTWTDTHWHVKRWEVGTTAPGSSGSPLYDSQNLIIGALTGGHSYCNTPVNDYYYALSRSWSKQGADDTHLRPFLAPLDTQVATCPGFDPYAPKSPKRLSNNLYSLFRDVIETTNDKLQGITAVAARYLLKDSSQLLGVMIVASPQKLFNGGKLLVMTGDEKGPQSVVHTQELKYPKFSGWNTDLPATPRTIGGVMEFFVPLEKELTLPRNTCIYVGVEKPDDATAGEQLLPIVRMKTSEQNVQTAWVKTTTAGEQWIESNSTSLSPELRYRGSYWIDLLTHPLEKTTVEQPEGEVPSIVFVDGRLRVTMPAEGDDGKSFLYIYGLHGERLFAAPLTTRVGEWNLSALLKGDSWFVAVVHRNGGVYSQVFPIIRH